MTTLRSWVSKARQQWISSTGRRPADLAGVSKLVSFCFDDFPRSALTFGGAILAAHGARGTYYTALGLMNTHNELGEQFHRDDLDAIIERKHELGCHTFQHLSCRAASAGSFEADVGKGRRLLQEMTGHDPANFAYPYGHVTSRLKTRIGRQMGSCRGIFGGVNGPTADLNLLRANSLYGDRSQLDNATALLRRCETGWLIFYTHDVQERPSPYGCTPELFEETVTAALADGFRIATVGTVIDAVQRRASLNPVVQSDGAAVPATANVARSWDRRSAGK